MAPPKETPEAQSTFTIPADLNYHKVLPKAREYFYKLDPNIIGIRIGPRRVKQTISPNELALVVYVAEKKPIAELDPAKVIPKEFLGLKTDVYAPLSSDAPQPTGDLVKDLTISADWRAIDPVRVHELAVKALPAVPAAPNVRDFGDVCVVDAGNLVFLEHPDFIRAYQHFRTLHGDYYDFVTFFVDEASGLRGGSQRFQFIFNEVRGIGMELIDRDPAWGSDRLEGFHVMNPNETTWRRTMLQEFGHRFAAFARYEDPLSKEIMTDHLLEQDPPFGHWAKALSIQPASGQANQLDDDKSPMDYGRIDWVELPNGEFSSVELESDERTYCNLDLYLMGLLGPDQVGEITMLRNIAKNPDPSADPRLHIAEPVRLNVKDFIAVEGARVPNVIRSQKHWRQAFIVLTNDMANVHDFVERVDALRVRWELKDFPEGTKGLGSVDTVLDKGYSNFTIIFGRRHHFGNEPGSLKIPTEVNAHFVGASKEFSFDCPKVDSRESALLMFQSRAVTSSKNIIAINDHNLSDSLQFNPITSVWTGHVLVIRTGTLKPSGNVLRIESRDTNGNTGGDIDDFILDNMVVMYKTR